MYSFKSLYTDLQTISKNTNATQLTLFKKMINETQTTVLGAAKWPFLDYTATKTTVASQNNYQIPAKLRTVKSVTVTVGTKIYRPKPVEDSDYWNYLQSLNYSSSDAAQYFIRKGNEVLLWPTPATSSYTITLRGRRRYKDLSIDDYTTGTITTLSNADETVTGSGTTWNPTTIGTHIKITPAASNGGDNEWYEINTITDATHLELLKPYEGTSIAAGSAAYTIGEFSIIPPEYHDLLLWRPLAIYFSQNEEDTERSAMFWKMYDGGYELGLTDRPLGLLGKMMDEILERNEGAYLEPLDGDYLNLNEHPKTVTGENWT